MNMHSKTRRRSFPRGRYILLKKFYIERGAEKRSPDLCKTIHSGEKMFLKLGPTSALRAGPMKWKGHTRFDMRLYWFKNGEWTPTKVGIIIGEGEIDAFESGILEAIDDYRNCKFKPEEVK